MNKDLIELRAFQYPLLHSDCVDSHSHPFIFICTKIICALAHLHLHVHVKRFMWDADTSRCKKAKHAQQYTLQPINSHLYLVHVKHSMALYNVQGVSVCHRAGQKAREGDAGLTCGGA